ncbi:MAG: hypothetical protein K2Q32_07795 [Alphaproteobacteria bacterium]|nr:hypothetical protein [Alphaproteobacteria bacterium]
MMLKHSVFFCALIVLSFGLALPADAARLHKNAPAAVEATAAEPQAAVVEEHAAQAAHEEGSGGLPQMDVSRFPSQLFWLAITFLLTYFLMKNVALPAVENTLENREKRISADIGGSKAKNEAAKHLMAEYEARLTKARSDAQTATRTVTDESSKKANEALGVQTAKVNSDIKAADARILEQKNKAIAALDKEVVSVVSTLVNSVAGITPSASDIEAALQKVRKA